MSHNELARIVALSSTGLTGLKEKLPELNGQYFYVLIKRD